MIVVCQSNLNIWVYEQNKKYLQVELDQTPNPETGLELKIIALEKYTCFKHVGPYELIMAFE
jgi:hypothetical protein